MLKLDPQLHIVEEIARETAEIKSRLKISKSIEERLLDEIKQDNAQSRQIRKDLSTTREELNSANKKLFAVQQELDHLKTPAVSPTLTPRSAQEQEQWKVEKIEESNLIQASPNETNASAALTREATPNSGENSLEKGVKDSNKTSQIQFSKRSSTDETAQDFNSSEYESESSEKSTNIDSSDEQNARNKEILFSRRVGTQRDGKNEKQALLIKLGEMIEENSQLVTELEKQQQESGKATAKKRPRHRAAISIGTQTNNELRDIELNQPALSEESLLKSGDKFSLQNKQVLSAQAANDFARISEVGKVDSVVTLTEERSTQVGVDVVDVEIQTQLLESEKLKAQLPEKSDYKNLGFTFDDFTRIKGSEEKKVKPLGAEEVKNFSKQNLNKTLLSASKGFTIYRPVFENEKINEELRVSTGKIQAINKFAYATPVLFKNQSKSKNFSFFKKTKKDFDQNLKEIFVKCAKNLDLTRDQACKIYLLAVKFGGFSELKKEGSLEERLLEVKSKIPEDEKKFFPTSRQCQQLSYSFQECCKENEIYVANEALLASAKEVLSVVSDEESKLHGGLRLREMQPHLIEEIFNEDQKKKEFSIKTKSNNLLLKGVAFFGKNSENKIQNSFSFRAKSKFAKCCEMFEISKMDLVIPYEAKALSSTADHLSAVQDSGSGFGFENAKENKSPSSSPSSQKSLSFLLSKIVFGKERNEMFKR